MPTAALASGRAALVAITLERLLDVQWNRVDQVDLVAALGEPERIGAGTAADVEHGRGRRWERALDQLQVRASSTLASVSSRRASSQSRNRR